MADISAILAAGVNNISSGQTVTFTKYVRLVLPLDGFVFWVNAGIVGPSAVFNTTEMNEGAPNETPILQDVPTITIPGSLHYATNVAQSEDETLARKRVIFTALAEVQNFNLIGPNVIYIATFGPDKIRFAFSQRQPFYQQADLYHYVGDAIYPAMESQIIDNPAQFDSRSLVVSNSLPIWLALSEYEPTNPSYGFGNPLAIYPSFAVPNNLPPPYASVHIAPEGTMALQAVPTLGRTLSHDHLVQDQVRVTLYGARNDVALTFMDCVNQYSLDYDLIGLMNTPVVRDEKRTQVELGVLAMKKIIDYEVSYYQSTARDMARQLILSAVPTFIFQD